MKQMPLKRGYYISYLFNIYVLQLKQISCYTFHPFSRTIFAESSKQKLKLASRLLILKVRQFVHKIKLNPPHSLGDIFIVLM
jgi:hypothetical protein